jgi:predicted PurR-regulated permease PerM
LSVCLLAHALLLNICMKMLVNCRSKYTKTDRISLCFFHFLNFRHLIGFFIFLCLTIFTATVIPRIGGSISSKIQQNLDQMVEQNKTETQLGVAAPILSPHQDEQLKEIIQMQMQPQCSWPLIGATEISATCRSSHVNNHTNACVQVVFLPFVLL